MTKENFLKILDFIQASQPYPHFKLLGGEPTEHPLFIEFMEEIIKRKLKFGLISNGLIRDQKIRDVIVLAIKAGFLNSILINAAELNKNGEIFKTFKENYTVFLDLYKTVNSFSLSCSVTFSRKKSCSEEASYIQWLTENIELHTLRISLDFEGVNQRDTFFINNQESGAKILKILELCAQRQIILSGDCLVYPCIFPDSFEVKKKLPELIKNFRTTCDIHSFPFDIAPDLSYFHCYPANVFKGNNLLDFANYYEAAKDFEFRKNIISQMRTVPEICENCQYYQEKICFSLCLGCTELNSPLLKPAV